MSQGQLAVMVSGPTGEERHLATLREEDHFGEVALLYGLPRTATVRARTSAQLLSLGREGFYAFIATAPDIREALKQAVASRRQAAGSHAS